jgi:hypothetical protein
MGSIGRKYFGCVMEKLLLSKSLKMWSEKTHKDAVVLRNITSNDRCALASHTALARSDCVGSKYSGWKSEHFLRETGFLLGRK